MSATSAPHHGPPTGYRESAFAGTLLVARESVHPAVCDALRHNTLHNWAAAQPGAVAMQGRGTAWATRLPDGTDVVVRHSTHGGALAWLTRDFFLAPSRAPRELDVSTRLRAGGVRTPEVLAYAIYSAAGPLVRADVVTKRVAAADLVASLNGADSVQRDTIARSVDALLGDMTNARATHPDLNARNILVELEQASATASVIDVDRVHFGGGNPGVIGSRNLSRLIGSLVKLQRAGELQLTWEALGAFVRPLGGTIGR